MTGTQDFQELARQAQPSTLSPRYLRWVQRPFQHMGYMLWVGEERGAGYLGPVTDEKVIESPDDLRRIARTPANFVGLTTIFNPLEESDDPGQISFFKYTKTGRDTLPLLEGLGLDYGIYVGLAQNHLFPVFPGWFYKKYPQAV